MTAALAQADEPCSYCGTWRPWTAGGIRFSSKDLLNVSETTIKLPKCTEAPFKIIEEKLDTGSLSDRDFPKPVIVKLKLMRELNCKLINKYFSAGTVIKLQVSPKFQAHSEELEVNIEDVNKNTHSPYWFLVRANHNPCDEGGKRGAVICQSIINNGVSYESLGAYILTHHSSGTPNGAP